MVFGLLFPALHSRAQQADPWIGKRVVLQFESVLRVGNRVVDNQKLEASGRGGLRNTHRVYRVEKVNGPWLWLQAEKEGASGWIRAVEVIPFEQAIDYYTNQIRANPANDSAYISRGIIWRERKEYDLALADYNEAVRLAPGSEIAWNNRGLAWYDKKEYDKSIADYNEAIRLDPKCAAAYFSRGLAWYAKKEYDKSIADYNEVIRLDPKSAWPHFGRAVSSLILRKGDAIDGMKRVLELEDGKGHWSSYAVIFGSLGSRLIRNDDGQAKELLGPLAAKLDAAVWPYPAVRYLRGELDEAGLLAQATDDDKRTEAHCFLGLDLLAKGLSDRALEHFRWVRAHGTPSFVEYDIALAELDRAGDKGTATRETVVQREAYRPALDRPAPPIAAAVPIAPKPDEPGRAAQLVGTILYVPTSAVEERFGTDAKPLGDYVNALTKRADAILAEAEPPGAKGLLIAVGLKTGKRSRVWCQVVEGEFPPALLRTLERELADIEPVALRQGPAGFGLKFALHGQKPAAFPEAPTRWADAAQASKSKLIIPPDDLFKILWPD